MQAETGARRKNAYRFRFQFIAKPSGTASSALWLFKLSWFPFFDVTVINLWGSYIFPNSSQFALTLFNVASGKRTFTK